MVSSCTDYKFISLHWVSCRKNSLFENAKGKVKDDLKEYLEYVGGNTGK